MSSYNQQFRQEMDAIAPNLWEHPENIVTLPISAYNQALDMLVERACQAQNISNITLAREALAKIPSGWLSQHLGAIAEARLDLTDPWEYQRLGELYGHLSPQLFRNLIARGQASDNSEIVEAAQNLMDAFVRGTLPFL